MKLLGLGLSGAVLGFMLVGCQPELAQVQEGSVEAQWQQQISKSYSGFKPPKMAPPAIKDNRAPGVDEQMQLQSAPPAPVAPGTVTDDMTVVVDENSNGIPTEMIVTDKTTEIAPAPVAPAPAIDKAPAKAADKAVKATGKSTEYVVQPGDTLSTIAKKFYKDGRKYNKIFEANKKVLKTPNSVKPGMKLVIPAE